MFKIGDFVEIKDKYVKQQYEFVHYGKVISIIGDKIEIQWCKGLDNTELVDAHMYNNILD